MNTTMPLVLVVLAVVLLVSGVVAEPADVEQTGLVLADLRDCDLLELTTKLVEPAATEGGMFSFVTNDGFKGRMAAEMVNGQRLLARLVLEPRAASVKPFTSVANMWQKIEGLYKGAWIREPARKPLSYSELRIQRSVRPRDGMTVEVSYVDGWPVWLVELQVTRWPEEPK